jgi:hypothetical protein
MGDAVDPKGNIFEGRVQRFDEDVARARLSREWHDDLRRHQPQRQYRRLLLGLAWQHATPASNLPSTPGPRHPKGRGLASFEWSIIQSRPCENLRVSRRMSRGRPISEIIRALVLENSAEVQYQVSVCRIFARSAKNFAP